MLRCISRYRNASLGIFVEPGEVLRELTPDEEQYLLRDSPGSFEPYTEDEGRTGTRAELLANDAPSAQQMAERERAERTSSEHGRVEVMTKAFSAGADAPATPEAPAGDPEAAAPAGDGQAADPAAPAAPEPPAKPRGGRRGAAAKG